MKLEGRLEEYKALRDEIIGDQKRIQEIMTLSMTAVGLLIGYGISRMGEITNLYFLAPLVIILPSSMIISTLRAAIMVKASYIRVKIEPKVPGLRWESLLYKHRRKVRRGWKIQAINENLLYSSMGFLCIALYLYLGGMNLFYVLTSASLFMLVLVVCVVYPFYPIIHEEKFEKIWKSGT